MLKLDLLSLFSMPKTIPECGEWYHGKVSGNFVNLKWADYLKLPNSGGLYVIYCQLTNELFVGNAKNFKERIKNLLITIKNGNCGNPNWNRVFEATGNNLDLFNVICFQITDANLISEIQSELMAKFRNNGLLLNKYYVPKVTGVIGNNRTNTYCCYTFKHKVTGKFYIGSCKEPRQRKSQHLTDMRKGTHANWKVQQEWNKDPNEENWEWTTFIHRDKEAARNHERMLLEQNAKLNSLCLNISDSVTNHIGSVMTDEIDSKRKANAAKALAAKFGFPVIVDGVEYPSIGVAADAIGVNQSTVSRWVKDPNNTRAVLANPELVAQRAGRLTAMIGNALKANVENNPAAKAIIVNGQHYPTVKAAMDATGINEKTLRRQAAGGLSSEIKWA